MNHRAKRHPALEWVNRHINLLPYVGLVLVMIFVVELNAHNQHEDLKDRCVASIDSRNAQRATVEAVYNLAIGAVQRDVNSPALTKEEVAQYNTYIDRANNFRESTYAIIQPSDLCAPYVDDNNVKPPTPPAPHVKAKETQ